MSDAVLQPREPIDLLVVSGSAADLELTLLSLAQCELGGRLAVARDGEAALELLLGAGGPRDDGRPAGLPRLVLLDLELPKLDGFEVLQQLKANPRTRMIPVVVFTSDADERDVVRCYQLGANSCVAKPVAFDAFRETVAELGRYWLRVSRPPFPAPGASPGRQG
ncbi:MAG TPA: response regulator [Gemmatimonadales bacterium]|nr:response regulator [Gemmatimonadales bacterium]